MRARHVPQRTCVACRRTGDQRSFVRLVRGAGGTVEVDERGRAPGRGAYLCRQAACWERGAKGALNGALRTTIDGETRAALVAYGAQFSSTPPAEGTPPLEGEQAVEARGDDRKAPAVAPATDGAAESETA